MCCRPLPCPRRRALPRTWTRTCIVRRLYARTYVCHTVFGRTVSRRTHGIITSGHTASTRRVSVISPGEHPSVSRQLHVHPDGFHPALIRHLSVYCRSQQRSTGTQGGWGSERRPQLTGAARGGGEGSGCQPRRGSWTLTMCEKLSPKRAAQLGDVACCVDVCIAR